MIIFIVRNQAHGPVHAWLGGIGGQCSTFDALADNGYVSSEEATILKHSSFALLKNAYRNHVIEMPTYCSADSGVEDCMWKCTEAVHPWRNGDFSSYAGQAGIKSLYEMANLTLGKDWEAEEQGGRLSKIVNKVSVEQGWWTFSLSLFFFHLFDVSTRSILLFLLFRSSATRPTGRGTTWRPRAPSKRASGRSTRRWTASYSTRTW